jgi:hypothetical protein
MLNATLFILLGLVLLIAWLLIIQKLLKISIADKSVINQATGAFLAFAIIGSMFQIYTVINMLLDTLVIMERMNETQITLKIAKVTVNLTVLNVLLFGGSFYGSHLLSSILFGKRIAQHELGNNHLSYALIRGILLLGLVIFFVMIFEPFFNYFLPILNISNIR